MINSILHHHWLHHIKLIMDNNK